MARAQTKSQPVIIAPPRLETVAIPIVGTSILVQHRFSQKALRIMLESQTDPGRKRRGKQRESRDPRQDFLESYHILGGTPEEPTGYGVPATAFKAALVKAAAISDLFKTRARVAFFVEADGYDPRDGMPLVRIDGDGPHMHQMAARLETGVASVAIRAFWLPGWRAELRITYDADLFDASSIAHLVEKAGKQIGVGEGRHDSPKGIGFGWGSWTIA